MVTAEERHKRWTESTLNNLVERAKTGPSTLGALWLATDFVVKADKKGRLTVWAKDTDTTRLFREYATGYSMEVFIGELFEILPAPIANLHTKAQLVGIPTAPDTEEGIGFEGEN